MSRRDVGFDDRFDGLVFPNLVLSHVDDGTWSMHRLGIGNYRIAPVVAIRATCAAAMQHRGASGNEVKGTGIYDERL